MRISTFRSATGNPLTGRHSREIGDLCADRARAPGRAAITCTERMSSRTSVIGDAAQEELKLLGHVAGRQADALQPA